MSTAKMSVPKTAQEIYALLRKNGVEVDAVSDERFQQDFINEKWLERFAHKPNEGQKFKPSVVFLTGRNLADKVKNLQESDEMKFISIRQIFRAIRKESESPSANKVIIGYPVTKLSGTFEGHYVYKVNRGTQSLSFLSKDETDRLIARHGAGNVHAFVMQILKK